MFTGIIQALGTVLGLESSATGARLTLDAGPAGAGLEIGDSLAVNGVCLTVAANSAAGLAMDVIPETLALTNLGHLTAGTRVNLERALRADSRLDGHFVLGHVDGTGTVQTLLQADGDVRMAIDCEPSVGRFVALKGSIAVDGVSLTVAGVSPSGFEVALIPHTLTATNLGLREPGDAVNLEVDVLARYLERLSEANT
jgi:riboflavin synthase